MPIPYKDNEDVYRFIPYDYPFSRFLADTDTPIIVGSPYIDGKKQYNSAYLLSPKGEILDIYSKIQLVPFAEYIPFIDNPLVVRFFDKLVGFSSGWNPGTEYKVFNIKNSEGKTVNFTVPICFEDAFPAVCLNLHNAGSEVLINITNDSWSKTKSAEYQHFVVAHFRAIELRTTLVRSTNSGYSVVVDPKGKIISDLPLFKAESLYTEVPVYEHKKTFYASYKDWFPIMMFLILIFNIFLEKKRFKLSPMINKEG